jgi:hypothetical protein
MPEEKLTAGEEFIYKWQYRMHSGFKTALSKAMEIADGYHLKLLEAGYPEEVRALRDYRSLSDWWPRVQAIGRKQFPRAT